ncbi:MAG: IS1380 family transposase [Chloroflexota bacterium]|nr:IS1380 family transposase [Chloroflexota bacterium]
MKKGQESARSLEIEFEAGLREQVTAHAGVALLVETARRSGVIATADRVLPAKKNPKGLAQGQMVESFVMLSALGGECVDDLQKLREDQGLEVLLGYELPAPSTARGWLEQCHDEEAMAERPKQGSFIPRESARLASLREVMRQSVRAYVAAVKPPRQVTLDVDAHLVESSKQEALMTYEGFPGYQPMLVTWAQSALVLADQFRDGNVPASKETARVVDEAYEALPSRPDGWEVRVRSDSAAYEGQVLDHWAGRGWKFAVSADMSVQLREEINQVKLEEWQLWEVEKGGFVREWAEVAYVPSRSVEKRGLEPYRYLAIRIRSPQGVLFSDGTGVKLFAVVTNDWELSGQALLKWHRGKAGTVEQSHRVIKDELAGGVYPSGKFGANAAWLRLQVLTNNLLVLMKATALDEPFRNARPKRLRFAIFNHAGRVVHHARQSLIRVCAQVLQRIIRPGLGRLRQAAWSTG